MSQICATFHLLSREYCLEEAKIIYIYITVLFFDTILSIIGYLKVAGKSFILIPYAEYLRSVYMDQNLD